MSGFITKAACKGRRPSSFASFSGFQRSELLSALLRERHVPRFIVAPDGYGKTSLAVEYAETALAWAHTFWISAKSPCFLRDLDEGTIAGDCLAADRDLRLVVFDDVPALDAERAAAFSRTIDDLLAKQVEVIVAMAPSCDVFGKLQIDRFRMGPRDLLLVDEELDDVRPAEERMRLPSAKLPAADRVASFSWHDDNDGGERFLRRAFKERVPADMLAFAACALVLRKGTLDDLARIAPFDAQSVADFAADYPHLGFDPDTRRFESHAFPIETLASALKDRLDAIAAQTSHGGKAAMTLIWADMLLERGDRARACDVVRLLCPPSGRGEWLRGHAVDLVAGGCFFDGLRLVRALRAKGSDAGPACAGVRNAFEAVCCLVLGDSEAAVQAAKRVAFDDALPDSVVAVGCYTLTRCANATLGKRARKVLAAIAGDVSRGELHDGADGAGGGVGAGSAPASPAAGPADARPLEEAPLAWRHLAAAWMAEADDASALADIWEQARVAGVPDDALCLVASRLFDAVATACKNAGTGGFPSELSQCALGAPERFVRQKMAGGDGGLSHFAVSAGLALEAAHVGGMPLVDGPLPTSCLVALRRAEMALMAQRRSYEQERDARRTKQSSWAATHPDALSGAALKPAPRVPARAVPTLSLRLFGRFEVLIGDDPVDEKLFKRQHVRSLLLILAINQGKEVSREAIVQAFWPNSADSIGRKNFYTIWALLKHALTLPDGTCPYLVRHQYGCSLEERYVRSDVARLNEICRELMFSRPDRRSWDDLSAEIARDFSSDLLPAVTANDIVLEARTECRSRLVDALVAAALNIVEEGNPQWAVWFAREALGHDDTREDAYVALMKAQIAREQRTSAMMTYLKCQRVLGERLGIDPSPVATALYQQLLEAM